MAKVSDSNHLRLNRRAISSGDPDELYRELRHLVTDIEDMYDKLAQAINENDSHYRAHTSHPPP